MPRMRGSRTAVVGGIESARAPFIAALAAAGLDAAGFGFVGDLASDPPDLIIATGDEPAAICTEVRDRPELADIPILAAVLRAAQVAPVLAAGASDVIDPAESLTHVITARARSLLSARADRRRARDMESAVAALVQTGDLAAMGGDAPETLRQALILAAETLNFDRASLVASIEGTGRAYVIAASDDATHQRFALSLADYPEVSAALKTREPVIIADTQTDPVTAQVAATLAKKQVSSVAVFPVLWNKRALGAVLLRRRTPRPVALSVACRAFGRAVAHMAASHLRDSRIIERLREPAKLSRATYEAERRIRIIDSLREHFEAAADGVVILDSDGGILFINRAAEEITGFGRDGLLGSPLADLLTGAQQAHLERAVRSALAGKNLDAFDLDLSTVAGKTCVSVTTSTVLAETGAVILSLRDVTAQRALATELRTTKDFLERLIDSTVDAIVAADMRGNVILFNAGAERICGYRADEVIGKISVAAIYPAGVAQQIMRMLRSTSYGGIGRLEQTRREILTNTGEVVPVNMTASMIYEDDVEIATVGIFSDLRERIRIEQRLLRAQEKLELSEKQAIVAELAGTAAHELNQPLTSILGYAQLILRQSTPDAPYARAVSVIESEAERMADIVKKIGRITRFETKEYVGGSSIIDLDRSSAGAGPEPPRAALFDFSSDYEDDEPTCQIPLDRIADPGKAEP